MTVSVNEVVLHQHFKKCSRTNASHNCVQGMWVLLVVCDRDTLDKSLNQNGVRGSRSEGEREFNLFPAFEH